MLERNSTAELIAKYKSMYLSLGPIESRAIGDTVHFNMPGFKHLVFKGKHRRGTADIYNRLVLVPLIVPVIRNCDEVVETRIR